MKHRKHRQKGAPPHAKQQCLRVRICETEKLAFERVAQAHGLGTSRALRILMRDAVRRSTMKRCPLCDA